MEHCNPHKYHSWVTHNLKPTSFCAIHCVVNIRPGPARVSATNPTLPRKPRDGAEWFIATDVCILKCAIDGGTYTEQEIGVGNSSFV